MRKISDQEILNAYFQLIVSEHPVRIESIPIKALSRFKPELTTFGNKKKSRSLGLRTAAALVASASANGIRMDGPCRMPRRFAYRGVQGVLENGVSRRILKDGTGELVPFIKPAEEAFDVTAD